MRMAFRLRRQTAAARILSQRAPCSTRRTFSTHREPFLSRSNNPSSSPRLMVLRRTVIVEGADGVTAGVGRFRHSRSRIQAVQDVQKRSLSVHAACSSSSIQGNRRRESAASLTAVNTPSLDFKRRPTAPLWYFGSIVGSNGLAASSSSYLSTLDVSLSLPSLNRQQHQWLKYSSPQSLHSSSVSLCSSLLRQQQQHQLAQHQKRWMSDTPSGSGGGGGDKKSAAAEASKSPSRKNNEMDPQKMAEADGAKTETTASTSTTTTPTPSSFDAKQQLDRALNTATEMTTRQIQRVGNALNVGDQLAVYGIILLAMSLLAAPVVIRAMKNSKRKDYFTDGGMSEDAAVDDFAQLAREEWDKAKRKNLSKRGGDGSDEEDEEEDEEDDDDEYHHSTLEKMLKDVIGSKALQQAAQQFVINILESDEFKTAIRSLVQELWKDLLQDPETLAQVIHILQVAIRAPQVQQAAQELVVDLVAEPEVKQALITVLQRLGAERDVLQATQTLLTTAAHQSLADPEILDHSMEFATDVLGDDIVQQTAGEALRNSVGHAIGHSLFNPNTALTVIGVGFLFVGMIALGNASTATTAMFTNVFHRGSSTSGNSNNSSRSVALDGTAAAAAATTPILQQVWDTISSAMGSIAHALVVSPIRYLGHEMVQAATWSAQAAYQHILVPPFAASASFLQHVWQWTGQQLVAMFVTPSNALLAGFVKLVQEGLVDMSRGSQRMWNNLNDVVAATVDTAWTAIFTTTVACLQWIVSQSTRVQVTILTAVGGEGTTILRTTATSVLDQSRRIATMSMQYLSQSSMRVVRILQEWFSLAVS